MGASLMIAVLLTVSPVATVAAVAPAPPAQVATTTPASTASVAVPTTAAVPAAAATSSSGSTASDPGAVRRIRRIVITLVCLAGAVFVITVLFWRATRPVPKPLQRLDTMASRAWRKADASERADMLGRPPPLDRIVAPEPPAVDVVAEPRADSDSESAPAEAELHPSASGGPSDPVEPAVSVDGAASRSVDGAASRSVDAGDPSAPGASLLADG